MVQALPSERIHADPELTTSEVADLLRIHPSTVKRWSNEGELTVHVTEGGHRRVRLRDALRTAQARELDTVLTPFHPFEAEVWRARDTAVRNGDFSSVHDLALTWILADRADRASELFVALGRSPDLPIARFLDGAIRGFMVRIGNAWENGQLRVGEEHMISQLVLEALLRVRESWLPASLHDESDARRPTAVVGAMEGSQHMIGSLCVRLALESAGWKVYYLGANVPLEEFSMIQQSRGTDAICVSFSHPHSSADVARCVRVLGQFYDGASPYHLLIGGSVDPPEAIGNPSPFLSNAHILEIGGLLEWVDEEVG